MRMFARLTFAAAVLVLLPTAASAQTSAIGGVVKDTSGAVLPGVTVEAASPALIEKVRSAISDSAFTIHGVRLYLAVDRASRRVYPPAPTDRSVGQWEGRLTRNDRGIRKFGNLTALFPAWPPNQAKSVGEQE